ncbi:MAG TPA: D-mannonate dehydratase ManD [Caulobacteraceae bacterium]|jgi:mannonate dehydratase|nr:D-mannonate dehydratase ManD [Caulobacteraceae bacterium]
MSPPLRIRSARVIVCSPGRNFVTLKIETDAGVYGVGDATLNGREKAVVAYLEDHVIPVLVGRDARAIEDVWQYLYRGAYWRRGPVTMRAIAAVDMALWDIKAKALGAPLYDLLGGASRSGVLAYGHANGADIEETADEVARYLDNGYLAVRAQTGTPGVAKPYGVSRDKDFYEPAEAELPVETTWSTPAYLRQTPRLFEALRERFGDDVELLHDAHHRLTPIEAAQLGKALEPYRLFWLEDPTPAENPDGFALIRRHTTTPLAVGEVFNSLFDAKALIESQSIDYLRATVLGCGGITHLRRIADFASIWQVRTGCHGATDLSPITMACALHFDLWVPNFGIQEYMRHTPETEAVFPHAWSFADGRLHPGSAAGHGADIDEVAAGKFPYQPRQLPVARLADGTMWNW